MDQQPKIPTLKDAQKPQVKIKGMGAGLTLFDRLKQFKKKDLAFILAGLGTLFMAPLAEHFMMAPENGDMSAGFRGAGSGSGGGLFGSGSSPYENGNNSIAQGGAIGGSGDIITPLNVRDPSALVMGPGGTQQPPAGSAAPAVAPPTAPESKTDYRDALAGAASRAASAAVKKAPLPVPKIALGGSGGLRGLGAASGGSSSGSGSLGPINSGNLGQAGTGGGGLNLVRSNPNFRGAAGPRGNSPTGLDNTKKAGANAGDAFSRTGSALGGLNAAASEQIPTGGQGFGGGGQGGSGANDKPGGGAGAAGSKSVGESLAFIEAKERMMENLKLEFEKRKLKDPELLMYGIRNDVLKAAGAKIGEGLTKWAMCKPPLKMGCPPPDGELQCTGMTGNITTANLTMCVGTKPDEVSQATCWKDNGSGGYTEYSGNTGTGRFCNPSGKGKGGAAGKTDTPGTTAPSKVAGELAASGPVVGKGLDEACAGLVAQGSTKSEAPDTSGGPTSVGKGATGQIDYYLKMRAGGASLVDARARLNGEGTVTSCGNSMPAAGVNNKTAVALQAEALSYMQKELPRMKGLVAQDKEKGDKEIEIGRTSIVAVEQVVKDSAAQIKKAQESFALAEKESFAVFSVAGAPNTKEEKTAMRGMTDARDQIRINMKAIVVNQEALEAAFKKAKETMGDGVSDTSKGTLVDVVGQNQAFKDLKAALESKKAGFGEKTTVEADKKLWPAASIKAPEAVNEGGGGLTTAVPPAVVKAKTPIDAACKLIGCVAPPKVEPNADAAAAPKAATDEKVPAYADASPHFEPATKGVTEMRTIQAGVIGGLEKDLQNLTAPK